MSDVNISKNRQNKEAIVTVLSEKVGKSKGIVFTNYQGLTHQQLESLKKSLKKVDADFVAAKNTLLLRALEGKVDTKSEKDSFTQPTAAMFIYNDIIEPLKILNKTIKDFKLPIIKFGFLVGRIVNESEVAKIASLPPLPVLQAQLLGQMKAPISGLHRALNWNLQSLVSTLNAIREKKS